MALTTLPCATALACDLQIQSEKLHVCLLAFVCLRLHCIAIVTTTETMMNNCRTIIYQHQSSAFVSDSNR
jgi:hypothetical protein